MTCHDNQIIWSRPKAQQSNQSIPPKKLDSEPCGPSCRESAARTRPSLGSQCVLLQVACCRPCFTSNNCDEIFAHTFANVVVLPTWTAVHFQCQSVNLVHVEGTVLWRDKHASVVMTACCICGCTWASNVRYSTCCCRCPNGPQLW